MPSLTVQNLSGAVVAVPVGSTLLAALQAAGHDWMHACGGKGRCTTCRLKVLSGVENLTPDTEAELRYRRAGRLLPHERLTCQTRLTQGDLTARVPEPTKLPHVTYSP
ncbi:2Fe-2S iron-sulfur cluster-binding protein [Hymenobacter sp. HDW8]|uniref:2Fe-2S iron-sulfur cluster-binding protein n=1 Tax=Hymenobacter sp. HDW8 TaxID=2714932 RepID=UPI00140B374F|nr:2Fe-2S iron-sulfur cluster-binding protein [Hymenobacter sp. HDW8]QIL76963.1 (2Fe-2S)-binding protein [Hymenobacter sp. HDW8]